MLETKASTSAAVIAKLMLPTKSQTCLDIYRNFLGRGIEEGFERLKRQPGLRALDVGCGNGALLRELTTFFPAAQWFGLDMLPLPEEVAAAKDFSFIHRKIEDLENIPEAEKFDVIFSIRCAMYIKDLQQALINIALALKPEGKAYIGMEPAYIGPEALELFKGPMADFFEWGEEDGAIKSIVIKQGMTKDQVPQFMAGFIHYQYPSPLLCQAFPAADSKQEPIFVSIAFSEQDRAARLGEKYLNRPIAGRLIRNWGFLTFLKFVCSKHEGKPFDDAVTSVYLKKSDLSEEQLIEYLLNPASYPPALLKDSWDREKGKIFFDHIIRAVRIPRITRIINAGLAQALQESAIDNHIILESRQGSNDKIDIIVKGFAVPAKNWASCLKWFQGYFSKFRFIIGVEFVKEEYRLVFRDVLRKETLTSLAAASDMFSVARTDQANALAPDSPRRRTLLARTSAEETSSAFTPPTTISLAQILANSLSIVISPPPSPPSVVAAKTPENKGPT